MSIFVLLPLLLLLVGSTVVKATCCNVLALNQVLFAEAYNWGSKRGFPAALFLSRMIVGAILPECVLGTRCCYPCFCYSCSCSHSTQNLMNARLACDTGCCFAWYRGRRGNAWWTRQTSCQMNCAVVERSTVKCKTGECVTATCQRIVYARIR